MLVGPQALGGGASVGFWATICPESCAEACGTKRSAGCNAAKAMNNNAVLNSEASRLGIGLPPLQRTPRREASDSGHCCYNFAMLVAARGKTSET
jgi:hypothetical protein